MKALIAVALIISGLAIVAGSANAAGHCYLQPDGKSVCGSCNAPAWDRTPIIVQPGQRQGAGCRVAVDPWKQCGTFCSAGQIPVGWPYGWDAPYWLRPDSNF